MLTRFSKWLVVSPVRNFLFMLSVGVIMSIPALREAIEFGIASGPYLTLQYFGVALISFSAFKLATIITKNKDIKLTENCKETLTAVLFALVLISMFLSDISPAVQMIISCILCSYLGAIISFIDWI